MKPAGILVSEQEPRAIRVVRGLLLAALLLSSVGTLSELLLIGHTGDPWQLVPVILLGGGIMSILMRVVRPGRWTFRFLQGLMVLYVVSGPVGQILHYRGNTEFELEMYPYLAGTELFWDSMRGATPVLAPGTLIYIGLVGLAYAYRHPLASRGPRDSVVRQSATGMRMTDGAPG